MGRLMQVDGSRAAVRKGAWAAAATFEIFSRQLDVFGVLAEFEIAHQGAEKGEPPKMPYSAS